MTYYDKLNRHWAAIADLDGTLIGRWSPDDYAPRPGPVGHADAILTNQGGLALRLAGVQWAKRYPGWRETLARVRFGMERSGAQVALLCVYHPKQRQTLPGRLIERIGWALPPIPIAKGIYVTLHPLWRKPQPNGLHWLMERLSVHPGCAFFLGDSDDDEGAAQAAGIHFVRVYE